MKSKKVYTKKTAKKKVAKKKIAVKKTAVVKTPSAPQGLVKVSIEHLGDEFNANGNSIVECLEKLSATLDPMKFKAKSIVTVAVGKKTSNAMMPFPFQIKRLLSGSMNKTIFEKRMMSVLK